MAGNHHQGLLYKILDERRSLQAAKQEQDLRNNLRGLLHQGTWVKTNEQVVMNKKNEQYTQTLASISEQFVIHLDDMRSLFLEERVKTNFRVLNKGIFKMNSIQKNPPKLLSLNFISDVSTKVSRKRSIFEAGFSSDESGFLDQDLFFMNNNQPNNASMNLKKIKDDSVLRWKYLDNNLSRGTSNKASSNHLNGRS